MVSRLTITWLFVWVALALFAASAWAQVPANSGLDYPIPSQSWEDGPAQFAKDVPFLNRLWPAQPGHVGMKAQPFGPAQTSGFGNGPRPNVGWWFSYERLFWFISQPDRSRVGAPPLFSFPAFGTGFTGASPLVVDNSFIETIGSWGNRWEIGYMDNTNYGWFVSVLDHVDQGQFQAVDNPIITFGDPEGLLEGFVTVPIPGTNPTQFATFDVGQLPGAFDMLEMKNILHLNGVELSREYRAPRLHNGGYFSVIYGVRYFQIDDTLSVNGFGNTGQDSVTFVFLGTPGTFPFNILDESRWSTRSSNNMVGPQIGFRWFRQRDHFVTSVEGRFLAAANFQNTTQTTAMGTLTVVNDTAVGTGNAFYSLAGLGTKTHQNNTVFSPLGELRVNVSYKITRSCALKVGYTGMVAGGVSRASNRVDYNSPNLVGILPANNREVFFVNGLNFGVELNR